MRIKITCGRSSESIPHIIHGTSANTMFWIIKSKKYFEAGGVIEQPQQFENKNAPSLPWDLDDFSRCVLVSNFFGYTETEIKQGLENIKALKYSKAYTILFENFIKMKAEFEAGNYDEVTDFLDKLSEADDE